MYYFQKFIFDLASILYWKLDNIIQYNYTIIQYTIIIHNNNTMYKFYTKNCNITHYYYLLYWKYNSVKMLSKKYKPTDNTLIY